MSYTGDERIDRLIDWCKVFTSKTEEELEESSKRVLSKTSASKLVSEVKRLSGDDEIMMEFDLNSKRDLKRNKQIEIARNLLKKNVDIDIVVETTGLTKEEIESINT